MYISFSKRLEAVLYEKCNAESKIHSIQLEVINKKHSLIRDSKKQQNNIANDSFQCENLQHLLEVLREDMEAKNERLKEAQKDLNICEDNLVCISFLGLSIIETWPTEGCGKDFFQIFVFILLLFQASTRTNYEEQISVMTEQIINLSEQLANKR